MLHFFFSKEDTASATVLLSGGPAAKDFDSIDGRTEEILEGLITLERKDIKYICAHRETREIKSVIINDHPFSLIDDKIGFIQNAYRSYTQEQATFIIKRAQEFYNPKIRPIGNVAF